MNQEDATVVYLKQYLSDLEQSLIINGTCDFLYDEIQNESLRQIFAALQENLLEYFENINRLLPKERKGSSHLNAHSSRELLELIQFLDKLKENVEGSSKEFEMDSYYSEVLEELRKTLSWSNGSTLPYRERIKILNTRPIFSMKDSIQISRPDNPYNSNLQLIGSGSYAHVKTFKDSFLNKKFALKCAKRDLDEKELSRFRQEYDELAKLYSPYIVEVYQYNEEKHEYIMENMDYSLDQYIKTNNNKIDLSTRKSLVKQIIKGVKYLHSKKLFHRDLSPHNILIKKYDDGTVIAKLSDFGLVKRQDSNLTTTGSEVKGHFIDPDLSDCGFSEFKVKHEIYALTKVILFTLTGKTNFRNFNNERLNEFYERGCGTDFNQRFSSVDELESFLFSYELYAPKTENKKDLMPGH